MFGQHVVSSWQHAPLSHSSFPVAPISVHCESAVQAKIEECILVVIHIVPTHTQKSDMLKVTYRKNG